MLSRLAGPPRPPRGRDGRCCCSRRSFRVARPVLRRSRRVRGRGTVVRRRGRASRSSQQPERARARPESYPSLGWKRQRRWGWALRPFCTPGARLAQEGEGWSARRGGPGREGTRAPSKTHSRCRPAWWCRPSEPQGPPAPLRRRCPPGRCLGGALATPRRRLRPEGRNVNVSGWVVRSKARSQIRFILFVTAVIPDTPLTLIDPPPLCA